MKLHLFATGAVVLCALTVAGHTEKKIVSKAMQAAVLGDADESATTHFSVYLPLTHQTALEKLLKEQTEPTSKNYRKWLTPEQFKTQFGPSREDIARVTATLAAADLKVTAEHTQSLDVEGPVWAVQRMFTTRLQQVRGVKGTARLASVESHLTMPKTLDAMGVVIPEFTTHVGAHVHSAAQHRSLAASNPAFRYSNTDAFYYPNDLNEAYQFPSFQTEVYPLHSRKPVQMAGVGTRIGIVIDSKILPADLKKTFNSTFVRKSGGNLVQAYSANSNLPVPTVTTRKVGQGSGPFDPNSDSAFEAALDTQMSLGTAPGATETLYDIEDLYDSSILAGYTAVDEDNQVDVVSSSFGGCELDYTKSRNGGVDFTGILKAYHALFQQGNAQGITFVASSGDNGAVPCLSAAFVKNPTNGTSFVKGVETPAADPAVTGVGGTNLITTATPGVNDAAYLVENADYDPLEPSGFELSDGSVVTVDNATWGSGGGFSKVFAKPWYQYLVPTGSNSGRSVPDVSMQMGGCPGGATDDCLNLPRSASIIWFDGALELVIGTSSSAPEFAGVTALAIELNGGRIGNINPLIYSLSALQTLAGGVDAPKPLQFFHRNISGNNNGYKVKPGDSYSEVLGNSTLAVKNFLLLLNAAPAGTPNTPSNP